MPFMWCHLLVGLGWYSGPWASAWKWVFDIFGFRWSLCWRGNNPSISLLLPRCQASAAPLNSHPIMSRSSAVTLWLIKLWILGAMEMLSKMLQLNGYKSSPNAIRLVAAGSESGLDKSRHRVPILTLYGQGINSRWLFSASCAEALRNLTLLLKINV